jgi:hypothetical protein
MTTVIDFPKPNKRHPNIPLIKEHNTTDEIDPAAIIELLHLMTDVTINAINYINIDYENKEHIKDLSLVLESMKSYIFKHHGLLHPFQAISEEIFTISSNGIVYIKVAEINNMLGRVTDSK